MSSIGKTFSVTGWKIGWACGPGRAGRRHARRQAVHDLRRRHAVPARRRRGARPAPTSTARASPPSCRPSATASAPASSAPGCDVLRPAGHVLRQRRRAPARLRRRRRVLPRAARARGRRGDPDVACSATTRSAARSLVRFAFCKRDEVIDEAARPAGEPRLTDRAADSSSESAACSRPRSSSRAPTSRTCQSGRCSTTSPALTLTDGHAALHQAIVGDRLRLALDADAGRARGRAGAAARAPGARLRRRDRPVDGRHPARDREPLLPRAACCAARRGSATRCARPPRSSRCARTDAARSRADRARRAARIRTVDQQDRPVLDFTRCAMLPLRDPERAPAGPTTSTRSARRDLDAERADGGARRAGTSPRSAPRVPGAALRRRCRTATRYELEGGDVVDCRARARAADAQRRDGAPPTPAPPRAGRRLVYGGHTIGLAAAQADAGAAGPRDDRRLARLRPPRARVRGRHAAQLGRARARRAAARRRRARRTCASRVAPSAPTSAATRRARLALRRGDGMSDAASSDRGLRVIEGSAFVAAPLGGMTLAQLGADVIRFDQIGGGLDHSRWPLAADGAEPVLGRAEQGQALDPGRPALRARAASWSTALIARRPARLFLTNFPARGWLAYDALRARREDLVMVALDRQPRRHLARSTTPSTRRPASRGRPARATSSEPLNSVLPAWDVAMGGARRRRAARRRAPPHAHRRGAAVRLALSDVAFAMVGNLGRIAEAQLGGQRPARRTATTSTAPSGTTSPPPTDAA